MQARVRWSALGRGQFTLRCSRKALIRSKECNSGLQREVLESASGEGKEAALIVQGSSFKAGQTGLVIKVNSAHTVL